MLKLFYGGCGAVATGRVHFPAVQHHLQHMGGSNLVIHNQRPLEGQPARLSLNRQVRGWQRHIDVKVELAALAWRAAYFDDASHQFHQALADAQPQPGASIFACDGRIGLGEGFEELCDLRAVHSNAGICDAEAHAAHLRGCPLGPCAEGHRAF